ncbi:MAG: flagellar basal body-associated FliL family protein [Verrucomicrobia bacterium]|nr:flagellar basal body-associated FliL family protein [Verrucomicrobiota bacterium]
MVADRVNTPTKTEGDKATKTGPAPANGAASSDAGSGGGFKAWLPLIITLVTMPALAYAITAFVLVPQLQKGLGIAPVKAAETSKHGDDKKSGKGGVHAKAAKEMINMTKVLVNVSGTMGSRYLLTSFTLAGDSPDFKSKVEQHEPQLRDLACGTLATKTINDLEKPAVRNLIRSELLSAFNGVLGENTVQEIFITEFAIQ